MNEKTTEQGASRPELSDSTESHIGDTTHEVVLSKDGFKLFPQPVPSDPLDPINWSWVQKHSILGIIMAL